MTAIEPSVTRTGVVGLVDRALIVVGLIAAPVLTLLVDQHVIGISTSVDIAALVTAISAGWHGQTAVNAVQARKA